MSTTNGKGSGSNPMAATADYNLPWAPKNTVLVADGFGNVASSEIPISTLGQVASGGSSIVANSTGITITDPFGGSINSSATQAGISAARSEEHTAELESLRHLV